MNRNHKFLVARRRNEQQRNGERFLQRLIGTVGSVLADASYLDAIESMRLEGKVWRDVGAEMQDGSYERFSSLTVEDAERVWSAFVMEHWASNAMIFLSHYRDFVVKTRWENLAAISIATLLKFDGDTVFVSYDEAASGIGFDLYKMADDTYAYEVDLWGVCRVLSSRVAI